MQTQTKIQPKPRLSGIDLCRGIAAYAVVLLHSGDETWASVRGFASQIHYFFAFPVPFFLAAAFYLIVCKPNPDFSLSYWKAKAQRLLVPYVVWTIIYVTLKVIMFSALHQTSKLNGYLKDPLAIIFDGSASVQLYFLPLLLIGTCLLPLGNYLIKPQIGLRLLSILSIGSLILYEILVTTENTFILGKNVAFKNVFALVNIDPFSNNFLRFLAIDLAWLIRCLPYLMIAILLRHLIVKTDFPLTKMKFAHAQLFLAIFIMLCVFGKVSILSGFREIFLGYSLLLYGIAISNHIQENKIIRNVGLCSFGIYLIHPLFLNVIEVFISKINPQFLSEVTVTSKMVFSVSAFILSWVAVSFLMRSKTISKYLFSA